MYESLLACVSPQTDATYTHTHIHLIPNFFHFTHLSYNTLINAHMQCQQRAKSDTIKKKNKRARAILPHMIIYYSSMGLFYIFYICVASSSSCCFQLRRKYWRYTKTASLARVPKTIIYSTAFCAHDKKKTLIWNKIYGHMSARSAIIL